MIAAKSASMTAAASSAPDFVPSETENAVFSAFKAIVRILSAPLDVRNAEKPAVLVRAQRESINGFLEMSSIGCCRSLGRAR